MKLDFGAVFEQLVGFYVRLPLAQKIALPVLASACMGLIIFVSNWATQPEWGVLYSNLSDTDAAAVVERLKDQKTGYRLTHGGSSIEITPPSMVHEVRLDMANSGLPKGDQVGFEIWDDPKMGISALGEMVNLNRAKQGELERTILKVEGVSAARVHITTPKRSVFSSRDVLPTASVLLKLKAGTTLEKNQVKGVAHLVAGSVERLTPDNVTILDQRGKMLNEAEEGDMVEGTNLTQATYKQNLENSYQKRIESMLTEILGQGRAVARVTAEIDFSTFEKEEESYDPAGTVMRSEREVQEGSSSTSTGGVPGVLSNLTNQEGLLSSPDAGSGSGARKESVRNYEVSRAVSKISKRSGDIQRLSVAVLVDGQYQEVPDGNAEDGSVIFKKEYLPLSAGMLKKVENLVKQTVGYNDIRGDIISVENIRFAEPDEDLAALLEQSESDAAIWKMARIIPGIILFLLTLVLVVRPLVKFLVTPTDAEVDLSRLLPAGVHELEAELASERAKLSSIPEKIQPAVDMEELETLLADNSRMVRENPQQAALLIRYWLNEGRI